MENKSSLKIDNLIEKLKELTGFCIYRNNSIISLCPFCERERFNTSVTHGHMYISIETLQTNCFRCSDGAGSIFSLCRKLDWDISEFLDDVQYVKKNWISIIKNNKYSRKFNNYKKFNFVKQIKVNNKDKETYLYKRLGQSCDIYSIPRIIFSLKEFIDENNIILNETDKQKLDILDRDYIGFVSNRGSKLFLRNVYDNDNSKDHKINLTENDFFKDFYGIRTGNIKEVNTLVFAEGIFDVLCGYRFKELENIRKRSYYWIANMGNRYDSVISSALDFCKICRANVIILSDKDVNIDNYRNLYYNPHIINLNIYYNKKGKDFGEEEVEPFKIDFRRYMYGRWKNSKRNKSLHRDKTSW